MLDSSRLFALPYKIILRHTPAKSRGFCDGRKAMVMGSESINAFGFVNRTVLDEAGKP
jgi:hypothetical protein